MLCALYPVASGSTRYTAACTRSLIDSGCRWRGRARLPLLIGRSTGPLVMWQRVGRPTRGSTTSSGVESVLVGLGAGQGQHGSVGMFGELVEGERGELAAAQRGEEPHRSRTRSRRPARSGCAGRVFQVLVAGAGTEDIEQLGASAGCLVGGAPDALPHRDYPCPGGRNGQVAQLVSEPDRRQPPAHRADLGSGAGQLGEVPADRDRPGGQWLQAVAGAPDGELQKPPSYSLNLSRRMLPRA
jgi:hypothetical protein